MNLTSTELEARIVGAVLARGDAIHSLPAGFRSTAMATDWRRPFEALERLQKRGALPPGAVDLALVVAEAKLDPAFETQLDQAAYLADSATSGNVTEHARMVLDRFRRRELRGLLEKAAQALEGDQSTADIVGKITARLLDLDSSDRPETRSWREAGMEWVDEMEAARKGDRVAVLSGFADLDRLVRIAPGKLIILAARPGVGKTTLALNVADNIAQTGRHVLVHSLEMDDAELVTLAVARSCGIDTTAFYGGSDIPCDWTAIYNEIDRRCRLSPDGEGTLHLNTAHYSLGAMCRITEKMHRKHNLALVVVDYLQLVECVLGKNATRNDVVSTITRTLKGLAQRLRVPILALSQLNRGGEKQNERPQRARKDDQGRGEADVPPPELHHLRDSGSIEQDANTVLFLHNPRAASKDELERKRGPYQLTVPKNRGGKKGRVLLRAELEFARFRPAAPPRAEPPTRWQPNDGDSE